MRTNNSNYELFDDHAKGAANELYAATFFIRQQCNVFWPAVAQGPVDFVLDKDGQLFRTQVKTAHIMKCGKYNYLQCRINRMVLFDKLIVVGPSGQLWDVPKTYTGTYRCLYFNGSMKRSKYNSDDWLIFSPSTETMTITN